MGINSDEKIGEGLIRIGAMTRDQVDDILNRQNSGNNSLFGIMALELGYIDDGTLITFLESKNL